MPNYMGCLPLELNPHSFSLPSGLLLFPFLSGFFSFILKRGEREAGFSEEKKHKNIGIEKVEGQKKCEEGIEERALS